MNDSNPHPKAVAVLGASRKPHRISNQAISMLLDGGYQVFPVHPVNEEIYGVKVLKSIRDIQENIDTVTLYLSEYNSAKIEDDIIEAKPRRIIFNPGAENNSLFQKARDAGIEVEEACTLVMLGTGQF